MNGSALRQRVADRLLEEIKEEQYPSPTFMDRVEAELSSREQVEQYAQVLLEKIESTRYPSIAMLNRFEAVLARIE